MILKFYHAELISQWTICWLFRRKSLWNMADVLINIIVSLLMGNIANPSGGTYSLITYVPLQISSMYTSFLGDRGVMCYHQVLKKTSGSSWWIGTIFFAVICGSETMNPNQQQQLGWHVCFRLQRLDWMDCGDVWFRHKRHILVSLSCLVLIGKNKTKSWAYGALHCAQREMTAKCNGAAFLVGFSKSETQVAQVCRRIRRWRHSKYRSFIQLICAQ